MRSLFLLPIVALLAWALPDLSAVATWTVAPDSVVVDYGDDPAPVTAIPRNAHGTVVKASLRRWIVRDTTKVRPILTTATTAYVIAKDTGVTWIVAQGLIGTPDSSKAIVAVGPGAPNPPTPPPPSPTLASITVAPSAASIVAGGAQTFAATGHFSNGSAATITPTWSETGGAISAGGAYTAGGTPGSFTVTATSGVIVGTAAVTITAAAVDFVTGPTPATCPGGAVSISAGENWATKATGAAAGASFCIHAGTHYGARNVVPRDNQKFYCEAGAIGHGGDTAKSAFTTGSAHPLGVRIEGCTLVHYRPDYQRGIIQADNGRTWVVTGNEIGITTGTGTCIRAGFDRWVITSNYIHDCSSVAIGYYGLGSSTYPKINDSLRIEDNRLTRNPATYVSEPGVTSEASQIKLFFCNYCIVRHNRVEDGGNKGIWYDTDDRHILIRRNIVERQGQACIWIEASYDGLVDSNEVRHCGTLTTAFFATNAGIQVTNSGLVEIRENVIEDADNGWTGMAVGGCASANYCVDLDPIDGAQGTKTLRLRVRHNDVTMPRGFSGVRSAYSGMDTVFTNGSIQADSNDYTTTPASPWTWLNLLKTKVQWQAYGFDLHSSFTP